MEDEIMGKKLFNTASRMQAGKVIKNAKQEGMPAYLMVNQGTNNENDDITAIWKWSQDFWSKIFSSNPFQNFSSCFRQ